MKELVWAISVEYMVDDGYGSFFSLFKNYDDALAAFQEQVEEETELMCDNEEQAYTEEDKSKNGAMWWHIENTISGHYSTVELGQVVLA